MDNKVFEKLKTLQDILAKKNALELEISTAPEALTTRKELLDRLKNSFVNKNNEYEELKKSIANFKGELAEAEIKRANAEKAMDNIETQREYEVLQKEIDDAAAKAENFRKEIQKHESNLRILTETIKQEEALMKQNAEEIQAGQAKLEKDEAEKKAEIELLTAEEKKLSPGLSEETMFKFNRIIKNKHGLGIVAVVGNVCTGCHMILPAQFVNEVRADNEIKFCPYCSRILFYEETEAEMEQEAFFDDSNMGGLSDLANAD